MANLYRNKGNGRLYVLAHLVLDIRRLNGNAFAGVKVFGYNHSVRAVTDGTNAKTKPTEFVENNFEKAYELNHLPNHIG